MSQLESPFDVVELDDVDREEWNRLVRTAAGWTPFHLHESLELLADASDMRLRPLVCYDGREPVGLFPVFERSLSFVSAVFSPPPKLKVPYLGPLPIEHDDRSPSSAERRRWRFVRSCLEHVRSTIGPKYMHFRTTFGDGDPRPFDWNGFDVHTGFTYVVDLTPSPDVLFEQFSGDVRANVRECEDAGCEVSPGGAEAVRPIVEHTQSRLARLGSSFPLDVSSLESLYEALPSGVIRPYVCTLDGEVVGGFLIFATGDTWHNWIGAATPDVDLGVNDALHWRAMRDCADQGATSYDLVGADSERLSTYKSKFGPRLEPFYNVRKRTPYMQVVEQLYSTVV